MNKSEVGKLLPAEAVVPKGEREVAEEAEAGSELDLAALQAKTTEEIRRVGDQAIVGGRLILERIAVATGATPEDLISGRALLEDVQTEMRVVESDALAEINEVAEENLPYVDLAEARKHWRELTTEQKLLYCNPETVRQEMAQSLALREAPQLEEFSESELFTQNLDKIQRNVDLSLAAFVKERHISHEYGERIAGSVKDCLKLIAAAQHEGDLSLELKAAEIEAVANDIVDKMVYQNKESLKRALGDHGVRHIIDGNITEAMKMVDEFNKANPSQQISAKDRLKIMIIHYNHDMGYTVGVNRSGFESTGDHPAFSQKLFADPISRDLYGKFFTNEDLDQINRAIATHDQAQTDFVGSPVESIVRLSDNLGLFHDSKLPEIFYNRLDNIAILQKIYIAREASQDISGLKMQLRQQIEAQADLDDDTRSALLNAAGEIAETAPKFNLGMFAGRLDNYRVKGSQMVVRISESDLHDQIQELFNLNQRQFTKLLESYGINLEGLGQGFEDLAKVDEQGVRYIEVPIGGSDVKPLRFEFVPDDPDTTDPRNQLIIDKFTEIKREWEAVSIRQDIQRAIGELESAEVKTAESVFSVTAGLLSGIQEKMTTEDLVQIRTLIRGLHNSYGEQDKFAVAVDSLKRFMTVSEKRFLSIQS